MRGSRCIRASAALLALGLLAVGGGSVAAEDEAPRVPERPVSITKWYADLQKFATRYRAGRTDVQTAEVRKRLREDFAREHASVLIEWVVYVRNVSWKDGVATIAATAPLVNPRQSVRHPMEVSYATRYELLMSREQALEIKPRTRVVFRANATFHPSLFTIADKQRVAVLRHPLLSPNWLGLFATTDYTVTLDGEPFEGRWHRGSAESRPEQEPIVEASD